MDTTLLLTNPVLVADTAGDLMTPNPTSISVHANVREGLAVLLEKNISGAPVIDSAGRPVGVVSHTDFLRREEEQFLYASPVPEYYDKSELVMKNGDQYSEGFQVEAVDRTTVREIMSPVVYTVTATTTAFETIQAMLNHRVHRMFVVDTSGTLVGVVSALDVLKHLRCG
jgi:CBS domain-containing protein